MIRKWVYFIPAVLFVIGIVFGLLKEPDKEGAYIFGIGIGFILYPGIPALIAALIHYNVAKNKLRDVIIESDLLDTEDVVVSKKLPFKYYFCEYLGGFALVTTAILFSTVA